MWVIADDGSIVNLANACSIEIEGGFLVAHTVNGETVLLVRPPVDVGQVLHHLQRVMVEDHRALDIGKIETVERELASRMRHGDD